MTWFERLMGFQEQTPDQVRKAIQVDGTRMRSLVNHSEFSCGYLEILSLDELRSQVAACQQTEGTLRVSEIVGDVQALHRHPENAGALFQVASQFNLLEMVSPSVTPERGVGIYENDRTQGPACAMAAGAGTIFRNYFAEVNGKVGQSADNQIDCLKELGAALGNDHQQLWTMCNGYALPSATGLQDVHDQLTAMNESERDELRQKLRIGIHRETQVTLGKCSHTVTQAFCSALPVAYCAHPGSLWEPFARLVLEAAYEATFCAAALNSIKTSNRRVFLTLLGGGAFGNESEWILAAIERSLKLFSQTRLEVAVVSYRASNPDVRKLLRSANESFSFERGKT